MCSPKIISTIEAETNRRRFLQTGGIATLGLAGAAAANAQRWVLPDLIVEGRFDRIVDCTYVLEPNIPNYFGLNMTITPVVTVANNGVFFNQLVIPEQFGTHFDTPSHFVLDGITGERIRPEQLVGTLVIIDIAKRAATDPDTAVTVEDIERCERHNGRIPRGAFVSMYSNWAARWPTAAYLNADADGTYHFPGFGGEAAEFLIRERDIIGIGVDTHSLDIGSSKTFPAHLAILGASKIGVEVLAGLGEVLRLTKSGRSREAYTSPVIFIGALRILHGSGSPVRALALIPAA